MNNGRQAAQREGDTMPTVEDFHRWEQYAAILTDEELVHAIQDCRSAEDVMRGWNEEKECFYSDQAATLATELRRRKHRSR